MAKEPSVITTDPNLEKNHHLRSFNSHGVFDSFAGLGIRKLLLLIQSPPPEPENSIRPVLESFHLLREGVCRKVTLRNKEMIS